MINIDITKNGSLSIVKITGELNVDTCGDFEKKFPEALNEKIILDMSALRYISSAGLRSLVILYEKVKEKNGKIILANLNEMVREIIEVSGFDALFEIRQTVEEAQK